MSMNMSSLFCAWVHMLWTSTWRFKLALEIPVHAAIFGVYWETGILPFGEIRKLVAAKYIIRNSTVANLTNTEVELRSDQHFPKKG